MKNKLTLLFGLIISICLLFSFSIVAQTTGSIAGTIIDQNGAVVPNATAPSFDGNGVSTRRDAEGDENNEYAGQDTKRHGWFLFEK